MLVMNYYTDTTSKGNIFYFIFLQKNKIVCIFFSSRFFSTYLTSTRSLGFHLAYFYFFYSVFIPLSSFSLFFLCRSFSLSVFLDLLLLFCVLFTFLVCCDFSLSVFMLFISFLAFCVSLFFLLFCIWLLVVFRSLVN